MKLLNDTFNSVKQLFPMSADHYTATYMYYYYLLHPVTLCSTIESPMFPFLLVFFV